MQKHVHRACVRKPKVKGKVCVCKLRGWGLWNTLAPAHTLHTGCLGGPAMPSMAATPLQCHSHHVPYGARVAPR